MYEAIALQVVIIYAYSRAVEQSMRFSDYRLSQSVVWIPSTLLYKINILKQAPPPPAFSPLYPRAVKYQISEGLDHDRSECPSFPGSDIQFLWNSFVIKVTSRSDRNFYRLRKTLIKIPLELLLSSLPHQGRGGLNRE